MSDFLAETHSQATRWCPACEPARDPIAEVLDTAYCDAHAPTRDGADDAAVTHVAYLTGTAEAGGDDNRRWCELLSRKKTLLRGPP